MHRHLTLNLTDDRDVNSESKLIQLPATTAALRHDTLDGKNAYTNGGLTDMLTAAVVTRVQSAAAASASESHNLKCTTGEINRSQGATERAACSENN